MSRNSKSPKPAPKRKPIARLVDGPAGGPDQSALDAALAALDAEMALPERQPGDLDTRYFMRRWNKSWKTVRARMKALVDAGEWEEVKVRNPAGRNSPTTVYRLKK